MKNIHLLILLLPVIGLAQKPTSNFLFKHFYSQDGFISKTCWHAVKTKDNMLWISTMHGLARFDAVRFKYFQHSEDTNSIAHNYIDQMTTDDSSRIWIVTKTGIDRFDPRSEKFTHCTFLFDTTSTFGLNVESIFYDDARKVIWAGTWKGLFSCKVDDRVFRKFSFLEDSLHHGETIFIDIKADSKHNIWLCGGNNIFKIPFQSKRIEKLFLPKLQKDLGAFCIYPQTDTTLWVGTWSQGLWRINSTNSTSRTYYYSNPQKEQNAIISICQNADHTLWLSTMRGLELFDPFIGTFELYKSNNKYDPTGVFAMPRGLLFSPENGLWIASSDGLHHFNTSLQKTKRLLVPGQLPSNYEITNLCILGAKRDSICFFQIPYVNCYWYNLVRQQYEKIPDCLRPFLNHSIFSAYSDKQDNLWLSTDRYGLIGYSLSTNKIIFHRPEYFSRDYQWVTIPADLNVSKLLIGTYQGLYALNKQTMKVDAYPFLESYLRENYLPSYIQSLVVENNYVWMVVSKNDGETTNLLKVNLVNETVIKYDRSFFVNKGIDQGFRIKGLSVIQSELYISTSIGLLRMNLKTQELFCFNSNHGLINNDIGLIASDKHHNLWMNAEFGLSYFNSTLKSFQNFTPENSGIGQLSFSDFFYSDQSGKLFVAQRSFLDIIHFQPQDVNVREQFVITDVKVNDHSLNRTLQEWNSNYPLKLTFKQNNINIEFSHGDFNTPTVRPYEFRLLGLNDVWQTGKNYNVTYSVLPPGSYTLQVKPMYDNKQKSVKEFIFHILPPFWKTWWFILIVSVVVILVILLVYRYHLANLLRLYKLKQSISNDLHDEVGSALTSINLLSKVSEKTMDSDPVRTKEILQHIHEQSKLVQQNISDIVWTINPDNDRTQDLFHRIQEVITRLTEESDLDLQLRVDEKLYAYDIALRHRKEILMVIKEALNNVMKHSGATQLHIDFWLDDGNLKGEITDNGTWKSKLKPTGQGLRTMENRMKGIGGTLTIVQTEHGTMVRFNCPIT